MKQTQQLLSPGKICRQPLLALCGALLLSAALGGRAESGTVTLTPVAGYNTLNITISANGSVPYDLGWPLGIVNIPINSSDTQTAQLGGNQPLVLEALYDAQHQGTATGVNFVNGNVQVLNTMNWHLALGSYLFTALGDVYVTGTSIAGQFSTPNPMSGVSGGTTFPLAEQNLILNGGTLAGYATGTAASFLSPFNINLATSPLTGPVASSGTGSVALSNPIVNGNTVTYTVTVTLPVNASYILATSPVTQTVTIFGTTRWEGTLTRLLPVIWNGDINGTWDIGTTANWKNNGVAATYTDGWAVQFDDTASGTTSVINTVTVAPAAIIVNNTNKAYTLGGSPISGGASLSKSGPGALTLTGANTFTGGTTISAGTLTIGGVGRLGGGDYGAGITNHGTLLYSSAAPQTLSGVISGSGSVVKSGTSTLLLTGANTFTGAVTVNGGTLNVGNGGATGAIPTTSVTVLANAALAFNLGPAFTAAPLSVAGNLTYTCGGSLSMAGTYGGYRVSATGTNIVNTADMIINAGSGGATLTGFSASAAGVSGVSGPRNITTTGNVTVKGTSTAGSYIDGLSLAGTFTALNGTLTFDGTAGAAGGYGCEDGVSGTPWSSYAIATFGNVVFKGTGGTTRNSDLNLGPLTGNGTVTLIGRSKGLNTFASFTSSGGLPYHVLLQTTAGGINGLLGAGTDTTGNGNYTVSSAGTVVFGARTINAGTGAIRLTSAGGYSVTGNTTLQSQSLTMGDATPITLAPGVALTLNTTAGVTLGNALTGAGGLIKGGANTLTLAGENTYTGPTVIGGGALVFSSAATQRLASIISGSGSLAQAGSGTLTLAGANTYTGTTLVSNGKLLVDGSLAAASAVTVAPAGTLGGTGSVSGTVALSGSIAPGASVGTLNTGAETWNAGGSYVCQLISTNPAGSDLLNITGALNVAATSGSPFILKLVSLTPGSTPGPLANFNKLVNYTWTIAAASSGVLNFATDKFRLDTSSFGNDFSGGSFGVALAGDTLVVNYTAALPVPPRFTEWGAAGMQLTATGGVGQAYVLLGTTNLAPASWTSLVTNTADMNGVVQFADPGATNFSRRFYRLTTP